ncbi:hypothetical protein FACS1894190_07930 [Spirochaetia bacterium]|nr:hypothetical protein FACS1894190_07930 [Spirochaetia bacterium]
MILESGCKRAAIYVVYDKQGIIDDYIMYQLNDLKQNIKFLLVVVNGELQQSGRDKLDIPADEILVRKNIGFDVLAWDAGLKHIGYGKLKEYDELLLMNDTCYGPFYPFKEMFDIMNKRDMDFWGITKHHGNGNINIPLSKITLENIPVHIQTYFICVRKSMFLQDCFNKYWINLRNRIKTYDDAVFKNEAVFTRTFEGAGFKSAVYINSDDLTSRTNYPLMFLPKELVANRRCPLVKRRTFCSDYNEFINNHASDAPLELYNYIRGRTNYDLNMIWDNLLRTKSMDGIRQQLQLNYIVNGSTTGNACRNAGINSKVILINNSGMEKGALLDSVKTYVNQYDYVCFAHDKKTASENIFADKSFIANVIALFEQNERLGFLVAPPPHYDVFCVRTKALAQGALYYTAWLLSGNYARMELNNFYYMIRSDSNLKNNPFENNMSTERLLKILFKRIIPAPVWKCLKKVYHLLKGK